MHDFTEAVLWSAGKGGALMRAGQKVVCIDDSNEPTAVTVNDGQLVKVRIYTNWIKAGTTYVIREVSLGVSPAGEEGQVLLLLLGVLNPPTPWKPFLEMGFNSERFTPIEEKTFERVDEVPQHAPLRRELVEV